jgi:hypothetical protein
MKISDRSLDMMVVIEAISAMLPRLFTREKVTELQLKEYIYLLKSLSNELMMDNKELFD